MLRSITILSGIFLLQAAAFASEIDMKEKSCLQKIQDEVDFILSGIERVNQEFEQKLKDKKLYEFKTSHYSTKGFLDNSIRKYRNDLTGELKSYPANYRNLARQGKVRKPCLAKKLQNESISIIHNFEITWEQTMEKAEKNLRFFKNMDYLK